jgi:hypothetical protein
VSNTIVATKRQQSAANQSKISITAGIPRQSVLAVTRSVARANTEGTANGDTNSGWDSAAFGN